MGERKTVYLECQVERIPGEDEVSPKEWLDWCTARGIDPLGGGRRAWWSEISTYIRGADYIVYFDGTPIDVIGKESLSDLTKPKFDTN